jgi:TonB family protein
MSLYENHHFTFHMEDAMNTFVPATAGQSHAVTLRSLEAEREFRKNAIVAFAIAVALHATVIASFFLFPETEAVKIKRHGRPELPPLIPIDLDFGGKLPRSANPKAEAGIPIPVPIVERENETDFASQVEMRSRGGIGGEGLGEGEVGGGVGGEPGAGTLTIEEEAPIELYLVEREPVLVRRATPKYPELLLKAQIEGRVTLKLWVDKEGKVREVRVLQGEIELFNEAAIEAAKQFLFTPAYMNAGPVSVWVSVPFTFRLRNSERTK